MTRAMIRTPLALTLLLPLGGCFDAQGPPGPEIQCPTPGDGTRHAAGVLRADETWTVEASPHFVDGDLTVGAGATLTLEPCVEVRMATGARLQVGEPGGTDDAALVAVGLEDQPISIGPAASAKWAGLVVFAPGTAHLEHVTLQDGGSDAFLDHAAVVAVGRGTLPPDEVLHVEHVVVRGSRGPGLRLDAAARFAEGSTDLTVSASGAEAMWVGEHALEGLPDGSYASNDRDVIVITEDAPDGRPGLAVDTTLRDPGVPFEVGFLPGDRLRVGANGGPEATLTVEAGVTLRFQPAGMLRVVSDADHAMGRLVVKGTQEAPVTFTGLEDASYPGAWSGLYFESPMAAHDVAHAEILYAGGHCSCSLTSCSPLDSYDAAVVLDGLPEGVFMRDSVIRDSAGHGFVRSWVDFADLDFLASNDVDDVAGCPQTNPELSDEVCPDPAFSCAD